MSSVPVAQPDVTLRLDMSGVIKAVSVSSALESEGAESLIGRPWVETVADVGEDKVRSMVEDARQRRVSAFRQVTQCFPSGRQLLIEYTTVNLGSSDGLLAIGRSLQAVAEVQSRLVSAQQEIEREYWKLREVETRYRLLFDSSNEAVLLVRAGNMRIVEANPAAIRALGIQPQAAASALDVMSLVAAAERPAFQALLHRVRQEGKSPAAMVHLGERRAPWLVRASLMTSEKGHVYLLQLIPVGGSSASRDLALSFEQMVESMPCGLVMVDRDASIVWANRSFLDLVQVDAREWVIGQKLDRWLEVLPDHAAAPSLKSARSAGDSVVSTHVRGESGRRIAVRALAAPGVEGGPGYLCLLERIETNGGARGELEAFLARVPDWVGERPLAALARDSAQLFDRYCIDLALSRADQDRTRAAAMLGITRNSLAIRLSGPEDAAARTPSQESSD